MKKINKSHQRLVVIMVSLVLFTIIASGQNTMPDALLKNNITEQIKYIEEHTLIYENYRAIREDIFQKMKVNVNDSMTLYLKKNYGLINQSVKLKKTIDSLNTALATVKTNLDDMTTTKNSIKVLGMEVNKTTYNSVMWLILAGLAAVIVLGFLILKRNIFVTSETKASLQELKDEFESYRKSSREAREKMSMDHFNELKKLKGG